MRALCIGVSCVTSTSLWGDLPMLKEFAIGVVMVAALTSGCVIEEPSNTPREVQTSGQEGDSSDRPKETRSQANARAKAEQYLDGQAFSRKGLIKQLKFEGFSKKDARYGVDAQNANWKKQAALKAEQYLDGQAFSRQGLIQQLRFEGFTPAQAEYGVGKTGL
jgi:hypothetical protein